MAPQECALEPALAGRHSNIPKLIAPNQKYPCLQDLLLTLQ